MRLIPLSIFFIVILFSSCCLHRNEQQTYTLSQWPKNLMTYQHGDHLFFKNKNGGEFDAIVSRTQFKGDFVYKPCGGECCPVSENLELESIKFDNDSMNIFSAFLFFPEKSAFVHDYGGRVIVFAHHQEVSNLVSGSQSKLYPGAKIKYDENGQFICNNDSDLICHSQMEINQIIYNNVFELTQEDYRINENIPKQKIYLTQKDGIIKIVNTLYDKYGHFLRGEEYVRK